MNKSTALLISMIISTPASAGDIVYLDCNMPGADGTQDRRFNISLDEASSTVSIHVVSSDATFSAKGYFGPDVVTWTNGNSLLSVRRSISRVDLTMTEDYGSDSDQGKATGSCVLAPVKDRKF